MKSKRTSSTTRSAKEAALYLLNHRGHSTHQLRKKLKEKEYGAAEIEAVIKELLELGYLNDPEWIRGFIRAQLRKRYGPRMIRDKLAWEQFREDEYDEILADELEKCDPHEPVRRLIETRYKGKDRTKTISGLMRKGYSYDVIQGVLNESLT